MEKKQELTIAVAILLATIVGANILQLSLVSVNPIHAYVQQGQSEVEVGVALFTDFEDSEPEWQLIKDKVAAYESSVYATNPNLNGGKFWFLGNYYMSSIVSLGAVATISINIYDSERRPLASETKTASVTAYFYGPLAGGNYGLTANPSATVMTGVSFIISTETSGINIDLEIVGEINVEGSVSAPLYVYWVQQPVETVFEESLPYTPEVESTSLPSPYAQNTQITLPSAPELPEIPTSSVDWVSSDPVPKVIVNENWVELQKPYDIIPMYLIAGVLAVSAVAVYFTLKRKKES